MTPLPVLGAFTLMVPVGGVGKATYGRRLKLYQMKEYSKKGDSKPTTVPGPCPMAESFLSTGRMMKPTCRSKENKKTAINQQPKKIPGELLLMP